MHPIYSIRHNVIYQTKRNQSFDVKCLIQISKNIKVMQTVTPDCLFETEQLQSVKHLPN